MNKIENYLINKKIRPNIKEFYYLKTAIELVMSDITYIFDITKRLYPEIGKLYNETGAMVERAMRYAIRMHALNDKYNVSEFIGIAVLELK